MLRRGLLLSQVRVRVTRPSQITTTTAMNLSRRGYATNMGGMMGMGMGRMGMMGQSAPPKKEGDISSVFKSLSGGEEEPLPPRFADVKCKVIPDRDALLASWNRLLPILKEEVQNIREKGSDIVPEINFNDIENPTAEFDRALRKHGVAIVRQVVPEKEARQYKGDIEKYIAANPHTKAFPPDDPQVFELYWSRPQLSARSHPNVLKAQSFLMSYYHSRNPHAPCSTSQPMTYADRLRIRQPGDAGFALGPHVDGGSVERWEQEGYGKGKVYDEIFAGNFEKFDPWELSTRLDATADLYNGAGACSMFRMFQGWLSMSVTDAREGTLLVNPLLALSTAYYLLRPFFVHKGPAPALGENGKEPYNLDFLSPSNWALDSDWESSTVLQGATPSLCQELSHAWHPHLDLPRTMVHVPKIRPGDYVAWHCDTVHAVDSVHEGKSDSSVMYIPACPLTKQNVEYAARQRVSFLDGVPPNDFPGGEGESRHVGRPGLEELRQIAGKNGLKALGFEKLDVEGGKTVGEREILSEGNRILGF